MALYCDSNDCNYYDLKKARIFWFMNVHVPPANVYKYNYWINI